MTQNETDYELIFKIIKAINDREELDKFDKDEFISRCLKAAKSNAETKTGLGLGIAFALTGAALAMIKSD